MVKQAFSPRSQDTRRRSGLLSVQPGDVLEPSTTRDRGWLPCRQVSGQRDVGWVARCDARRVCLLSHSSWYSWILTTHSPKDQGSGMGLPFPPARGRGRGRLRLLRSERGAEGGRGRLHQEDQGNHRPVRGQGGVSTAQWYSPSLRCKHWGMRL